MVRLKVYGQCWNCRNPVRAGEGIYLLDASVMVDGKPVRRLAHHGNCADRVRAKIGGNKL